MLTCSGSRRLGDLEGVASLWPPHATAGRRALLRDRGLRRTTPDLTTESLLRGAAAAALPRGGEEAGAESSLHDAGATPRRCRRPDRGARGAAQLPGCSTLVPVVTRSPLQAFARLHALAASGRVAEDELGRPRPEAALADAAAATGAVLLADRRQRRRSRWPAIAHAEVRRLARSSRANGLVARAFERLVSGLAWRRPDLVVVPEAGHLALEPSYRAALGAYGRRTAAPVARPGCCTSAAALTRGVEASPLADRAPLR